MSCSPPAATTTTSTADTPATTSSDDDNKGDLKILNYALTLEYLETEFYKQVIASGIVKDKAIASLAKQFGETEQAHVDALDRDDQEDRRQARHGAEDEVRADARARA